MFYLKDLLSGLTLYFCNNEISPVNVPRYPELTIKAVTPYAMNHPKIKKYLPDLHTENPQIDRHFLFTIINTIEPEFFPNKLRQIESRKQAVLDKK